MDIYEYPLLHQPDLMLAILRVSKEGGGTLEDCRAYLRALREQAQEDLSIDEHELLGRLEDCRRKLERARLIEGQGDRFRITPRGNEMLEAHPGGIDETVLMQFEEFRATLGETEPEPSLERPVPPEYEAGYHAFDAGRSLAENPHPRDSRQHLDWQNGWSQARDVRLDQPR